MECTRIVIPGGVAIICSRGGRRRYCVVCGRLAGFLCDFPLAGKKNGRTCSRPLCERCKRSQAPALSPGDSLDYCPTHDELARAAAKPKEPPVNTKPIAERLAALPARQAFDILDRKLDELLAEVPIGDMPGGPRQQLQAAKDRLVAAARDYAKATFELGKESVR